ncbi:MAG: circadian clock KaiB family protein [Acidimicrobiales bacterium]|nr:circadian clock KaiB family protein [Acidimicrobiales bacterium]
MPSYAFQLYVSGDTPRSHLAATNLRQLIESAAADDYELEVIDVLERPDLAEQQRILATPFVIKTSPAPSRRVVGDLSDLERASRALDLHQRKTVS